MLVNSNFLKLGLKFFFYSKLLYAMDSDFALLWDNPEIKAKYGGAHTCHSRTREAEMMGSRLDLAMQQDLDSNKSKHCLLFMFLWLKFFFTNAM